MVFVTFLRKDGKSLCQCVFRAESPPLSLMLPVSPVARLLPSSVRHRCHHRNYSLLDILLFFVVQQISTITVSACTKHLSRSPSSLRCMGCCLLFLRPSMSRAT